MTVSEPYPRLPGWLHRRGIIRVINSDSSSMHDRVTVRVHARRWIPAAAVRWHLNAHFAHNHPLRAPTHRLDRLTRSKPTVAGTVKWEGRFASAAPRTVWAAPQL